MNNCKILIVSDLKRLLEYRIIHFVIILTALFGASMAFFPDINPSNFIYITIFILPVIIFSISMFIEREENTLIPILKSKCNTLTIVVAKILSSMIIQLIPIVTFILVLAFINKLPINYLYLFLVYILGVLVHILIGLSLSIISKSNQVLSLSYVAYILVFSMLPIFFSNGFIPLKFQYYLIISPAFLSGVLIDNIMAGMAYSSTWLIVLSVVLQFVYGFVLVYFVIRPYFKTFLLSSEK
ncbi:MAG: ABC transporter permease [Firmicutes bacterium]|nr:ABC transporter permease [Bacillota bacterium]